ncbi:MAG TPA: phosphoribosylformylglycinamidine cyclo-ligase [Syntrophales bacterium]|nr:phosphoribosylformylglycinamidine cyclo-ligase [Syntrophales bacterium]
MEDTSLSYRDAGVDIDGANLFVEKMKPFVKSTFRKEVLGNIGGFGALFHLDVSRYRHPVLVSCTDGVGTKLRIAQLMGKHDTVGIDLVAMNVNDLIVQGAEPLFFLDYLAIGKMDVDRNLAIIEGISKGCVDAGCALIGGETAEMPGFYKEDEYDLAGFAVGAVEREKIIDGSEIRVGDALVGIASSGIHSNGYSLVRKVVFDRMKLTVDDLMPGMGVTVGEELIRPTKIYVKVVMNLVKTFPIKGIVHITGGGFFDNIPRILPDPCRALIRKNSWEVPPVFQALQDMGRIDEREMHRVFNMGVGMILVVPEKEAKDILDRLSVQGEKGWIIGTVEKKDQNREGVILV